MNEMQSKLLGGYAAVRINNEKEFNEVVEFLAIKNCFLANKEPVTKMSYPGGDLFVLYRADDGFIWWSPVADIDTKKYQLVDVKKLGLEEVNDQTILEANATVVEEVGDVNESNMTLVVTDKPENSTIPSNIDELVALIPTIEAKANVVVTAENYKSFTAKGTGIVPELRRYAKNIKDEKKKLKDSYMKSFDEFSKKVDLVVNALETTAKTIANNVDIYEQQRKDEARKEKMAKIEELKKVLVEKGMLSQEYADKFAFDEHWLNVSCSNKKFMEEANKQFHDLIEQEKLEKQNIEMIENTIVNTCQIAGVDEKLINRNKYQLLVKAGQNLGDITKMITDEVNALKQQKEAIAEAQKREEEIKKQRFEEQQKEVEAKHQQELEQARKEAEEKVKKEVLNQQEQSDSNGQLFKRGDEVIGKTNGNYIITEIKHVTDERFKGKTWTKTFEFTGDLAALQMLNRYMDVLKQFNETFDFHEVKPNANTSKTTAKAKN